MVILHGLLIGFERDFKYFIAYIIFNKVIMIIRIYQYFAFSIFKYALMLCNFLFDFLFFEFFLVFLILFYAKKG